MARFVFTRIKDVLPVNQFSVSTAPTSYSNIGKWPNHIPSDTFSNIQQPNIDIPHNYNQPIIISNIVCKRNVHLSNEHNLEDIPHK